jgi:hypothetical protein
MCVVDGGRTLAGTPGEASAAWNYGGRGMAVGAAVAQPNGWWDDGVGVAVDMVLCHM